MRTTQEHCDEIEKMTREFLGEFPLSVCMDHSVTGYGPDEHRKDCAVCGLTTMNSYLMLQIAQLRLQIKKLSN